MPIGSIVGGIIGAGGASAAGGAMGQAGQDARYNAMGDAAMARSYASPWYETGKAAQNALAMNLGLGYLRHDPNQLERGGVRIEGDPTTARNEALAGFKADPGYQFRQNEGRNALDRGASAKGMVLSGAQQRGVDAYSQGMASEEYGKYIDRLLNVSGMGAGSAASANNNATSLLNTGNALNFQGQAGRASSYANSANALASGISKGIQNAGSIAGYNPWGMFGNM